MEESWDDFYKHAESLLTRTDEGSKNLLDNLIKDHPYLNLIRAEKKRSNYTSEKGLTEAKSILDSILFRNCRYK